MEMSIFSYTLWLKLNMDISMFRLHVIPEIKGTWKCHVLLHFMWEKNMEFSMFPLHVMRKRNMEISMFSIRVMLKINVEISIMFFKIFSK